MKFSMQIKGDKKLQKQLTDWKDSRVKALIDVTKRVGREIRKDARRKAPKKTGRLRRGIKFFFKKTKRRGIEGFVRSTMPYSRIIEIGSTARNIPPRPFMQQAVDENRRYYTDSIEMVMSYF